MADLRTPRQQATVDALLAAALAQLDEGEGDGLTVRAVAARAGVTHTTAYTYFSTREHLVAAVYWREVAAVPRAEVGPDADLAERVAAALDGPSRVAADHPALARAGLTALLADSPAVAAIRSELGADVAARLHTALGPAATGPLVESLATAYTGAMLQAGMGVFPFTDVPRRMATLAALLDR